MHGGRVVINVLGYFGVTSRPPAVKVALFNALAWLAEKVPVSEWPPEAYSIGVGGPGGTVRALGRAPRRCHRLSPNRRLAGPDVPPPARGISIPGPGVFPPPRGWNVNEWGSADLPPRRRRRDHV
jgi:hypothetical protein